MTTALMVSILVPVAAGAAFLAARRWLPRLAVDVRGIALQTVIVMVVLLAIAGGVAAVLLTRGGEAVEDIERQQITRPASDYTVSAYCVGAGHSWNTGTCVTT